MNSQIALALRAAIGAPKYTALALAAAATVFIFALWLPNIVLVRQIAFSGTVPLAAKARILLGLVGSISTNFTTVSAAALIVASLLFGVNVALLVHGAGARWRTGMSASLGGFASSLVGIGCAACGTFVLGPLIAIAGTGSIIAALPLGGGEFIALGICLLAVSLWLQARAAGLPVACATPIPGKVFPQKEDK